jgi:protein-tyrosine phosphatase
MTALSWEGCFNVRDLGDHPTEDGSITRHGVVVRADTIHALTDAGWQALVDYGVERVVDLRFNDEREADPPRELAVEIVHVPLLGAADRDGAYFDYLNERLDTLDGASYLKWSYLDFLDRFRANFAAAVGAVAEAEGTALVHCFGGKDRTGLVCALILRLAGVSLERIDADYALSGVNLVPFDERWIAEATDEVERQRRRRLTGSVPGVMLHVVGELERDHGSVVRYLVESGASEAELAGLRARLRS